MSSGESVGPAARAIGISAVVVIFVIFVGAPHAGATAIPAPAPADRDAIVAELARAADAQRICYGWRLSDVAGAVVSQGSNLGAEVAVDSDSGRCPRWVELRATVGWTPEWSESEDWATRELVGSADLAAALPDETALDRVGATEKALIDDPAEAVLLGVLAVPLLVAERGIAPPVPPRTSVATPDPAALTDPGSDFWRDRGVSVAIAIGLIVVAGGVVGVGWWATRRAAKARQARRREPGGRPRGNPSGNPRRKPAGSPLRKSR